ncbi:facilitated trehalose transporter Tret1-like [Bombyx mandarina]|uniref:Facilitated trehalose transporter Tret1-like n=1 Tax=Bombyx mandarina TaxID=7092 RepID=A0A6J2KIU8_BOMMA|nr:facilitated trehalose transporter Tret1-like [Bombyx mandarina]
MVHKIQIEQKIPSVSKFRSVLSQLIACMSPNLLLLDLGMAVSFPTIALPALLNATEGLSLTQVEASWFGSISYLAQPFGALLSGPLVDYFGRKKANFLVNIPHLIAWILMYFAWNVPILFIANTLLGIGTGIMEAPINSYVGEISEPTMRGALCTVTQIFTSIGILVMYFLGTIVDWRQAAIICLGVPLLSMLLVLLVPETPVWLLFKGREKEALKSLCYLRGWTTVDNVKDEYDKLAVYAKSLQNCEICLATDDVKNEQCDHVRMNPIKRYILKIKCVMFCKETLRPLTLVILYFMFYTMSGLIPIRPNMVNVCGAFGMVDNGKKIVLMIGVITVIMGVIVIGIIKMTGKRKLIILALLGTGLSSTGLSIYARLHVPDSVSSYDPATFPIEKSYVPQALLYSLAVFTGLCIPWVLLGEMFPFKSRASAQGIAAAWSYVVTFLGSKTLIDLENSLKLWGTFAVYAVFAFVGTIYLYFFMPETEGKTLQDIEDYYKGDLRIFANDPFINYFKRFKRKQSVS